MAIGSADGGEQNAPMGRAVIGGVITSTLLTLVVVPVIYTYLDSLGRYFKRKFFKPAPAGGGADVVHAAPEND
jgi:HAE1 family hydrophobic/amphiphilic exporter-1